jgi:rRNA maturation RNase YbeY
VRDGKEVEAINYVFCNDEYLLGINQEYLRHDTLTDIITFELSGPGQPLLADIFISVERVRENAANFKVSFLSEIRRVIFHGVLHLAGYKDKKKEDKKRMREKEAECLQDFISFT